MVVIRVVRLLLNSAGFTTVGIAAGSLAAFFKAILENVRPGTIFALLQRRGTAGVMNKYVMFGAVGTGIFVYTMIYI